MRRTTTVQILSLLLSSFATAWSSPSPGDIILGMDQVSLFSDDQDDSHPFYKILPHAMTADIFASISQELSQDCRTLDLAGRKVDIPVNTTLLFVFNSTQYLSTGCDDGDMSQFMQTSVPFGLPQYHALVDYFLLVPANYTKPFAFSPDLVIKEINARKCRLPLFLDMIGTSDPLLALIFKSVHKPAPETSEPVSPRHSGAAQQCKQRLKEVCNSPDTSGIARAALVQSAPFFDEFAHLWVGALGLESLYSSVFCQVNEVVTEQSFCLQITTSESRVSVIDPVTHGRLGSGDEVNPNGHGVRIAKRDQLKGTVRIATKSHGKLHTVRQNNIMVSQWNEEPQTEKKNSTHALHSHLEISPWQQDSDTDDKTITWSAVFDGRVLM
ncbi:hypothetical protein B0I72DRAFT_130538 [Yarrowia lipolytica]|uniref:YALI0E23023p n=2 Tax=Yarrowia lipolytica TaxID=4952 RepID=Q6C4X2_YARLI|nr:YALI0E23023p [Yarrowia lipolytica CLIB122]AOW05820.1 hypothetical protein YALI1_E27182g [Yarrowia lipolytica]KAB8285962.1 hypothetical protein BKA91DRAFT_149746 [Yarrowia lipolytica]KAE8172487.1 hypothetical protein BKA90DRAFT_82981 [Yarrowia lipolytica]KAJ8057266.1 hypothetical protein LXG23DRAFT_34145 [Yarrowia lipolytica]RDW25538.1 hypothetical protein B0I71DRAFT_83422 [Yarrowia lipolytica]|eukprot:XP_504290.1 YALI0E23023p [Yarrowia lipolytica CLIB122]